RRGAAVRRRSPRSATEFVPGESLNGVKRHSGSQAIYPRGYIDEAIRSWRKLLRAENAKVNSQSLVKRVLLRGFQLDDIGGRLFQDVVEEQLLPFDETGEFLLVVAVLVINPVHTGLLVRDDEFRIEYRNLGFRQVGPDGSPDVVDLPGSNFEIP